MSRQGDRRPDDEPDQDERRDADADADPRRRVAVDERNVADVARTRAERDADKHQRRDHDDHHVRQDEQAPGQRQDASRPTARSRKDSPSGWRPPRAAAESAGGGGEAARCARGGSSDQSPFGGWPLLKASVKPQGLVVCRNSAGTCWTFGDGGVREIVLPKFGSGCWLMLCT